MTLTRSSNYIEILQHKISWKNTPKVPKRVSGMFEVEIRGQHIPWNSFTFFSVPNEETLFQNCNLLIRKFESMNRSTPQAIIRNLKKDGMNGTFLFRDTYFMKSKIQISNGVNSDSDSVPNDSKETASHQSSQPLESLIQDDGSHFNTASIEDLEELKYSAKTASDPKKVSASASRCPGAFSTSNSINSKLTDILSRSKPAKSPPHVRVDQNPTGSHSTEHNPPSPISSAAGQEVHNDMTSLNDLRGYEITDPPNRAGVYVLKLDNGKYYVGKSESSVKSRVNDHISRGSRSAVFVKANTTATSQIKYLRPKTYIPEDLARWEEEETIHAMLTFGFRNVRGYVWAKREHDLDDYKMIRMWLQGRMETCYKCGRKGHLACACPHTAMKNSEMTQLPWLKSINKCIESYAPPKPSLYDTALAYQNND